MTGFQAPMVDDSETHDPHASFQAPVADDNAPPAQRSILGTGWRSLIGGEAWDVPGGGSMPEVKPQSGGWHIPVDTSLAPGPNVGNVVPLSKDPTTGKMSLALPNIIRGLTSEGPQLDKQGNLVVPGVTIDPSTSRLSLTPEAALSASLLTPGAPRFGVAPSPLPRILELLRDPNAPLPPTKPATGPGGIEMRAAPQPPPPPPVPTYPQAKAIRDAWYDVVDQNPGAAVKPEYATQGINAAVQKLQPEGPLSAATSASSPTGGLAIKLSNAADKPITLGDYAAADKDLTGLVREQTNPTTAGKLRGVQADLRQHFEGAGPDETVGGEEGFKALDPARRAHVQVSKMGDVKDMIYRSGMYDNEAGSMQSQLRNYLTGDESRNLTDLERAALERAQKKGALSTGLLGMSHLASPWVGALLGGPKGAVLGELSRGGFNIARSAIARARVQDALRVLGQSVPPPPQ